LLKIQALAGRPGKAVSQTPALPAAHRGGMIDIAFVRGFNIANTAPVVHVRQNQARKPIETAQPRSMVALIEASIL
jgi:hypothetical protein